MPDQGNQPSVTINYLEQHADIRNFFAKDLFFIGANPKSGSTWLQVMLNAHPDISCRGEGHFIDRLSPSLRDALKQHSALITLKNTTIFNELPPFPPFLNEHFRYLLTSAIALLLMQSANPRTARVIGEKTPNNVVHFAQLHALFPHAKFLHVLRDGRDCAVSAWFHNQRTNPEELRRRHPTFEHFAESIAQSWKVIVAAGNAFCATHPGRCLTVRYDELSLHPRETMVAVLAFLGVAADDNIVARCVDQGAFEKMSGGRLPGMEDRSSFMRQGQSGNWRQHFTPEANRRFLSIAGEAMTLSGFHGQTG
jgi:Sulfotransferase family